MAVARLAEEIPGERGKLLQLIAQETGGQGGEV